MSEDRMEPLDSELSALVDAERRRPDMPADAQARLLQRVTVSVGGVGSGGIGHGPSVPTRFFNRRIPFGLTASALGTLDRSAKQFPSGRLVEERESLRVQALVQAQRYAEARTSGNRFRKRFPTSMLLPVVNSAIDAIP